MKTVLPAVSGFHLLVLLSALPRRADAQPVATEDDAVRVFTGFRSSPAPKDGEVVFEKRLLLSATHRILHDFDVGLSLPMPRFAPDVSWANPMLTSMWHITHNPVWVSLRTFIEPPLLNSRPLNIDQSIDWNIRSIPRAELFGGFRSVFIVTKPKDSLFFPNLGIIFKAFDTLGIGPEANARFTTDGFDTWAVGTRFRLEVRYNQKPLAVWFVTMTLDRGRFETSQMNLLTFITWYWRS